MRLHAMSANDQGEPVEFEKQPVEVQDFKKMTNRCIECQASNPI